MDVFQTTKSMPSIPSPSPIGMGWDCLERPIPYHPKSMVSADHPTSKSHWYGMGLSGTSHTIPYHGPSCHFHPQVPLVWDGTVWNVAYHTIQRAWSQLFIPPPSPIAIGWDLLGHPILSAAHALLVLNLLAIISSIKVLHAII